MKSYYWFVVAIMSLALLASAHESGCRIEIGTTVISAGPIADAGGEQ